MIEEPRCFARQCRHLLGVRQPNEDELTEYPVCEAFPDGIPQEISYGDNLHIEPYQGDHGIQYEQGEFVEKRDVTDEPRDESGKWTTSGAGYSRNKDKQWVHPDTGPMNEADQARMNALGVPPAWTDVHLNPDPKGELQVLGKDAKGRQQYLYSAAHNEASAVAKFARLKEFNEAAPAITAAALNDMKDRSGPDREAAAALYLISQTGFRIGSTAETLGDAKAYGATTLTADHVKLDGSKITFSFSGKHGVQIDKTISNGALASFLRSRVKAGGDLFHTSGRDVREYLKRVSGNADFKPKDFRTWWGTGTAIVTMKGMPRPKTAAQFKKARAAVGDAVAAQLGNTRSVALSAYIDPSVFAKWDKFKK